MRNIFPIILVALLLAGCSSPRGGSTGTQSTLGSPQYQSCIAQCQPGNAGNGTYCKDGCRLTEASKTNDTSWCDQLDNKANIPSCYGTVAKSSNNVSVCNSLSNPTDRHYCVAVFGSPSTS